MRSVKLTARCPVWWLSTLDSSMWSSQTAHALVRGTNTTNFLVINKSKLTDYLAQIFDHRDLSFASRPILDSSESRGGVASSGNQSRMETWVRSAG